MSKIVTLTINPALDKSMSIEHVVPDRKLRCGSPSYQPGGGGVNVARVVQRLGGSPLAVYAAGGAQGKMFRELLQAEQVKQQVVGIEGLTRESVAVLETATDQQFRFSTPGPELTDAEWRRFLSLLDELDPQPEFVVLSGGIPPGVPQDFYARVARQAQERPYRIILDTSGEPLRQAVAAGVYLIKPNLRELRQLTGEDLHEEKAQVTAVSNLVAQGSCAAVALSLGAAGALLATQDGTERLRAPTVTIRSKVGAGDSMVGGIVWSLAQGRSLRESVQYGVAAGAATVKTPGTELCALDDVQQLYQRIRDER